MRVESVSDHFHLFLFRNTPFFFTDMEKSSCTLFHLGYFTSVIRTSPMDVSTKNRLFPSLEMSTCCHLWSTFHQGVIFSFPGSNVTMLRPIHLYFISKRSQYNRLLYSVLFPWLPLCPQMLSDRFTWSDHHVQRSDGKRWSKQPTIWPISLPYLVKIISGQQNLQ